MLENNSKTYLDSYRPIINRLCKSVNDYTKRKKLNINEIRYTFFLRFLHEPNEYYKKIIIKKNNSHENRYLFEPNEKLKYIQKYILHGIIYPNYAKYKIPSCVKGFVVDATIVHNAEVHLNKYVIIKMDLKNFFPTINRMRVFNIFREQNYSYEYSYILSKLLTYNDQLPQGAPTSPFISNVCAKGIDYKVLKLIKKINESNDISIMYTRYADDLTLSINKKFNYDYLIRTISNIIESEGFIVNSLKTRVIKKHQCQKVTGIVVNNNIVRVEKNEINKMEFILKVWLKYGTIDAINVWNKNKLGTKIKEGLKMKEKFQEVIRGKLNFIEQVNRNQSEPLQLLFQKVLNGEQLPVKKVKKSFLGFLYSFVIRYLKKFIKN